MAYDRAGLGASDPVWPLALSTQVDDLAAVIGETGNGPSVVAGHGWGGLFAQLAGLDHQELIAGLVLVDPADEKFLAVPRKASGKGSPWGTLSCSSVSTASWRSPSEIPSGPSRST